MFASGHSASPRKGPCSALLPGSRDNEGLLPSAEKPLIRGRGTWLQPLEPLSRGQPGSAGGLVEVAGCAPFLIWEALRSDGGALRGI